MHTTPLCNRILGGSKKLTTRVSASESGSGSQPPVSALDRVLRKAANKVKLAHPVGQTAQDQKPKEPSKRPAPRPAASWTTQQQRQSQPKQSALVDDDALFNSITESERDSVWDAFTREVEADGNSDGAWIQAPGEGTSGRATLPRQQRSTPASAPDAGASSWPVASSSGFKGFGAPPRRSDPVPRASAPTTSKAQAPPSPAVPARPAPATLLPQPGAASVPAAAARQKKQQARQAASKPGSPLRVFLFNAEEARTRELLQQLGLAGRVEVVDDLRHADAVVAAKLARSGKHVNLMQGERTAANLGIPFLVVGRNMSADSLRTALLPLLDPAAAASRPAAARAPTAAELYAHRMEVVHGFAQMLKQGAVAAPPAGPATGAGTGTGTGSESAAVESV